MLLLENVLPSVLVNSYSKTPMSSTVNVYLKPLLLLPRLTAKTWPTYFIMARHMAGLPMAKIEGFTNGTIHTTE